MKGLNNIIKENMITISISILGILGAIILGSYNVKDLTEAKKAEETLENLRELRVALEKYYQATKTYPNLTLPGVKDNLKLLDFENDKGTIVSFAEIYGHNSLPKTPEILNISESNQIYDISDFSKGDNTGGWNYNYTENTGEIHVNLPENIYSQGIDWSSY